MHSFALNQTILINSGPIDMKRKTLTLYCSLDLGKTWPYSLRINPGVSAAYSVMSVVPGIQNDEILVVWEQKPGMLSYRFGLDWCTTMYPSGINID
jgi:hypothetical protein